MERVLVHTVTPEQDGRVLRDILRRELGISAKLLARIKRIENGIEVNGQPVFVNIRVCAGDTLRVVLEASESQPNLIPVSGQLDIRYEDRDILIVNKPAGLPVQPAIGDPCGSLGNIVVGHYAGLGQSIVYRPVNRLDSGTSGLMAIAKNSHTHSQLINALQTDSFRRTYRAIVHGVFEEGAGVVDAPIARCEDSVIARCVDPRGKCAKTYYNIIKSGHDMSLVELKLESGRTHQIRVHMAHIGHALVGDFLYGREEPELIARCALHSYQLSFTHPFSGETVDLTCEMPEDMRRLAGFI